MMAGVCSWCNGINRSCFIIELVAYVVYLRAYVVFAFKLYLMALEVFEFKNRYIHGIPFF